MKVIKIDEEGNRSISYTIVTWEKRKGYQRWRPKESVLKNVLHSTMKARNNLIFPKKLEPLSNEG